MKLWGNDGRIRERRETEIIEALRELDLPVDFKILDIACGAGEVLGSVKTWFPDCIAKGIDILPFPSPEGVEIAQMDLVDLIRNDEKVDVVMMLNSYRNWEGPLKGEFDAWVKRNATYFITSLPRHKIIGLDTHELPLFLFYP